MGKDIGVKKIPRTKWICLSFAFPQTKKRARGLSDHWASPKVTLHTDLKSKCRVAAKGVMHDRFKRRKDCASKGKATHRYLLLLCLWRTSSR
jgi:hypothetical protein